ncbi:MAG TPA: hypothetical protein VMR06_08195 [Dokdonella sp.]|uniref:hypothetical protein n=1 Tax=Dokdonella sp. TaxID=2291710 RepID=UPI002BC8BB46|nr:hypothetical protein [Dokdonella sp.]HUD41964.1 hypothetical protein [Dokdonella sp.]
MRRIVIREHEGIWMFEGENADSVRADSPLRAAMAALEYGETLRGKALGYIIRLDHRRAGSPQDWITLHSRVF